MTDENKVDESKPGEPAQDDGKDYKAMYEQAVSESRFDYQSKWHYSKTTGQPEASLGVR